jgi:hypothetical protein
MPGAFLFRNLMTPALAVTATVAVPDGMPLSNLFDPQPRTRCRLSASSGAIVADLGVGASVDCVYLGSTSLGATATVRVGLSVSDATGAARDAWDSGVLSPAPAAATFGQVVVLRAAGPATGRYLRVDVADGAASVLDIGIIAAGALWRLARGPAYGIAEGRLMLDRRDRNPLTGAEFAVPALANPRSARFSLPALLAAEVPQHRAMLAAIGAAGDGLWVPDVAMTAAELAERAIWGALAEAGGVAALAQTLPARFERSFSILERI